MGKRAEQSSSEYSHKPMQYRVIAGFITTIALIVAISIVSFRSLDQLKTLLRIFDTPDKVNTELYAVLNLLTEEELLLKDFFTSREPARIQEYNQLKDSVSQKINRLSHLMQPDSLSMTNLINIKKLVDQKHNLFDTWFNYYAKDTIKSGYFEILHKVDSLKIKITKEREALAPVEDTVQVSQNKLREFFTRLAQSFRANEVSDSSWIQQDSIYLALIHDIATLERSISEEVIKSDLKVKESEEEEERLFQRNFLLTAEIQSIVKEIVEEGQEREAIQKNYADQQFMLETKIVGAIIVLTLLLIAVLMAVILRDLRHIEKHKNALVLEKNSANKLADLKSRFLSNMSHEIRTPLTSIIGYSEQLKKKLKDQGNKEYVDIIFKSSEHLLFLVNEILTFSRLEANKISLDQESFQMQEVLEEVHEILKLKAEEKNLEFELHADAPYTLIGDPLRLKQIFINLIGNAIKFTNDGRVEFGVYLETENEEDQTFRFFVRDTGIGIPEDKVNYIFEEFNQAYKESYGKYGGTGLGLSICKQLINLHNGTVDVYSKPGHGTEIVFTITYKVDKETQKTEEVDNQQDYFPSFDTGALKILIIDDDEFNAMLGQQILSDYGFLVDVAHTGREGLNQLEKDEYHLLLLDINLPDIKGYEVLEILKKKTLLQSNSHQMRIVALSANVVNLPEDKLKKSGFDDKFIKPFHEQDFIQFVKEQMSICLQK